MTPSRKSSPTDRPLTTILVGPNASPRLRSELYLKVCVVVRTIIAVAVLVHPTPLEWYIRAVALGAMMNTVRLLRVPQTQWWSREWVFFISALLVVVNKRLLGWVLLLSVAGGLGQFFFSTDLVA